MQFSARKPEAGPDVTRRALLGGGLGVATSRRMQLIRRRFRVGAPAVSAPAPTAGGPLVGETLGCDRFASA